MTELPSRNEGTLPRAQERHQPLRDRHLRLPVEEVQKGAGVDDIDASVQLSQGRRQGRVEDVRGHEDATEAGPVEEQAVARFHQAGVQIRAVEVFGRRAVEDQFADVLPERAAEVEECVPCFHAREDFRVEGRSAES